MLHAPPPCKPRPGATGWNPNELGTVIAEWCLNIRTPKGKVEVKVQIGAPQPSPDRLDWLCPYRIQRAGDGRQRYAAGVDAVQALELVTQIIEADLFLLNRQYGGRLCWPTGAAYFAVSRDRRSRTTPRKQGGKKRR